MRNSQLIEQLNQYPPDIRVHVEREARDDWDDRDVDEIILTRKGPGLYLSPWP